MELKDLGEDIKKNGLRQPVVVWYEVLGSRLSEDDKADEEPQPYLLDGRNRLDAMELVGIPTIGPGPENYLKVLKKSVSATLISAPFGSSGLGDFKERPGEVPDPTAYVISSNIKRRHLTKKQQADLIVKAVESAKSTDLAKVAKSVKRTSKGRVQGSTKDPVKAKVLEEAQKNDISKRTAERAIADHRASAGGTRRSYVTCPECSASVADLDRHLKIKHKSRRQSPERTASCDAVRDLENALMKAKQATGSISVYAVLADKAALKKMLRLYDQLEESITLGREKVKNRPSDKEIGRALNAGTSKKEA